MNEFLFTRTDDRIGEFAVRPLRPDADAGFLHPWLTHPKARFWLMRDTDAAEVAAYYHRVVGHPHREAFVGFVNGQPAFLAERYDPARVELVGLYEAQEGDVGMHFLCAPTHRPVHGFTLGVITTVVRLLFADPATRRIVVEPDVRNAPVHALNAAVGFQVVATITKPEKVALLSVCTRERFLAVTRRSTA